MPETPIETPISVAILILPSVVPFDLGVPMQVFGYPGIDLGVQRYRATLCAPKPGPVRTANGFDVLVTRGLGALRQAHTIVLPGVHDLDLPIPRAVSVALQRAAARGARLVSICSGAFMLAEAGLLDGRRATTHWMDAPLLASRYPQVRVDPDVLYVDEGQVLTSAGIACGIDLCLHVVRKDFGAAVAATVARRLVVPPHRDGSQAQFVDRAMVTDDTGSLDATRQWARTRLGEVSTVDAMARHAALPLRTFTRRFRAEVGTSPLQWLLMERLQRARTLLESTALPLSRIAEQCGFGSVISMRAHFRTQLHTSPHAYRRAFRAQL
ncbi:MAG TPA: AraC family transcriptional regulator [Gemmatimonas aurantiaca]|uniref:AraC family transcriptional regulator n=2 Tax=Gemmatimonas aurantiaca TaxID=173480 RepID=C1ACP7_GEMAT|nr:helix-turn-helix domain-containing protein [Gemmatimonas aurantiaca]BAH40274.1 AraC family transcriptional regulator [Gemmatimonas aurantiaca T-27]HCT57716.1 AraC family transcriptional regulator [Gemmatimonas aurantiaca]